MVNGADDAGEEFAFTAPPRSTVPIAGAAKVFPVRRIYCVGRNYREHIREMGGDEREPPFFFQKPTDAIVRSGSSIAYPMASGNFQHEIELVLAIGRSGERIATADAQRHIFGVAAGIDLTRRDLQLQAREAGRPWESGKSFDQSAPISAIHPLLGAAVPLEGRIWLDVNGTRKQDGNLREMIWRADEIVSHLSLLVSPKPGDLIYTGTPAGVGRIEPGDHVEGAVEGVDSVVLDIRR
jgi:fumarylpyruvate hydrolase